MMSNQIPRTNRTVEGLPGQFCPRGHDDFEFFVKATPDEAWLYLEVLRQFLLEDVSILHRYASRAYLGGTSSHGNFSVSCSNDEFRAREVAEALNEVLTRINAAG